MEKVKHWFFKNSKQNSSGEMEESIGSSTEEKSHQEDKLDCKAYQQISPTPNAISYVDPKVAEFFKEFPEPYKQRLIERYSSKDGIYRFDFIRDIAMSREYEFAAKGVLLEERREEAEYKRKMEEEEAEKRLKEYKESLKNRQVPEWEKSVKTVIPLQEGETMGLKLFQAVNMSLLGIVISWAAIRVRKTDPSVSKLRYTSGIVGSLNLCAFCQAGAVYRLMDWGIFDNTFDDRDVITKVADKLKKSVNLTLSENFPNDNKSDP